MTATNARAKETAIPLEPSNLLLIALEPTPERKKIFAEDAFKKKEAPKKEKKEAPKEEKKEVKKEKKEEKKPPEARPAPEPKAAPPKEEPAAPTAKR